MKSHKTVCACPRRDRILYATECTSFSVCSLKLKYCIYLLKSLCAHALVGLSQEMPCSLGNALMPKAEVFLPRLLGERRFGRVPAAVSVLCGRGRLYTPAIVGSVVVGRVLVLLWLSYCSSMPVWNDNFFFPVMLLQEIAGPHSPNFLLRKSAKKHSEIFTAPFSNG